MALRHTLDKVQYKAMTAYASRAMAPMPHRDAFDQFAATVTAVTDVAPHVRRITVAAPEFATYDVTGPDEYFGLLMPGERGLTMPDATRLDVRAALARLPEADRPPLRWYTIRHLDRAAATMSFDVVTHGTTGPGSAWALQAAPGGQVGIRQGKAVYAPQGEGPYVLVADETAAPALAAIIEAGELPAASRLFIETPDAAHLTPLPPHPALQVHHRADAPPGQAALEFVRGLDADDFTYFWLCGESALATGCRRHLVKEAGVPRTSIIFSGYWKLGQARG